MEFFCFKKRGLDDCLLRKLPLDLQTLCMNSMEGAESLNLEEVNRMVEELRSLMLALLEKESTDFEDNKVS